MKFTVVILSSALLLAACAKAPDQIAAADIDDSAYVTKSCRDLAADRLQITQALDNLSADQKKAKTGDAWGVFLLGLPLSSMSGGDKETAIAIAKGKIQAIDRARERKHCSSG